MYIYIYIYTSVHPFKCMYIHTYAHDKIHTYKYTYMHLYVHTYIHAYIYTYTYIHTYTECIYTSTSITAKPICTNMQIFKCTDHTYTKGLFKMYKIYKMDVVFSYNDSLSSLDHCTVLSRSKYIITYLLLGIIGFNTFFTMCTTL